MAKAVLGKKGMERAVKGAMPDASVVMLAQSYDKLVRDLEYILTHLSEENFLPQALDRIKGEGR